LKVFLAVTYYVFAYVGQIQCLDLSNNIKIGDEGFRAIIRSLNSILKELRLRNCGLSSSELKNFAKRLNETGHEVNYYVVLLWLCEETMPLLLIKIQQVLSTPI